jgi:hypothetical protein
MREEPGDGVATETTFSFPVRRCERHSFALMPDGSCLRCRTEARRGGARRKAAWACLLMVGTVASGVALTRVGTAHPSPMRAMPSALDLVGLEAFEGSAASAAPPTREHVGSSVTLDDPLPTAPLAVIISTSLSGQSPEERDRGLAKIAAEREAIAQRVARDELAAEDEALAAMRRRVASEAIATPAPPALRAPAAAHVTLRRRPCGCKRSSYEFDF